MNVIWKPDIMLVNGGMDTRETIIPQCPKCLQEPTYNLPECPYCGQALEYDYEEEQ